MAQQYVYTLQDLRKVVPPDKIILDGISLSFLPGAKIGIIAPDGKQAMLQHSQDFPKKGIPHIFDPGQAMTQFDGDELRELIANANWIIANDYEYQLLQERTRMTGEQIARQVWALVVTKGGDGSVLYEDGKVTEIAAAGVHEIKDPTGCGDAYRAGFIHGVLNDMDLETACRIGSIMGAIKIEHLVRYRDGATMVFKADKLMEGNLSGIHLQEAGIDLANPRTGARSRCPPSNRRSSTSRTTLSTRSSTEAAHTPQDPDRPCGRLPCKSRTAGMIVTRTTTALRPRRDENCRLRP